MFGLGLSLLWAKSNALRTLKRIVSIEEMNSYSRPEIKNYNIIQVIFNFYSSYSRHPEPEVYLLEFPRNH